MSVETKQEAGEELVVTLLTVPLAVTIKYSVWNNNHTYFFLFFFFFPVTVTKCFTDKIINQPKAMQHKTGGNPNKIDQIVHF